MSEWPFAAGEKPPAEKLGAGPTLYTPAITATTTNPVLGADGFARGWWVRVGPNVIETGGEINLEGAGANLGGASYRILLPFAADLNYLVSGVLNTPASAVGSAFFRSDTSAGTRTAVALLSGSGEDTSGTAMIFYRTGSNASIGGGTADMALPLRIMWTARYVIPT